jgi:hypothetical protein
MKTTLCTNIAEDGAECMGPIPIDSPVSMCAIHTLVAMDYAQSLRPVAPPRKKQNHQSRASGPMFRSFEPNCVYYLRMGDRIKIGTSTNLPSRLRAIAHEELMAVQPGGMREERQLHRQFAGLLVAQREWFRMNEVLAAHVRSVRQKYGEPLAAWEAIVAEVQSRNA